MVNKIQNDTKEESHGIGLDNIIKRLQLGYAHKHRLQIIDENNYYRVELTLKM